MKYDSCDEWPTIILTSLIDNKQQKRSSSDHFWNISCFILGDKKLP
jgi:hypothetical protein